MATKGQAAKTAPVVEESIMEEGFTDEETGLDLNIESDFDVDAEFKPTPLIVRGTYLASITNVKFDPDKQAINFQFTLQDNGGVMSDGTTPVDGSTVFASVWLPKPGDEDEMTKDGRMNKRQAKINMLKQFADGLGINMNSAKAIIEGIQNAEWIGLSCRLNITTSEYEGRVRNDVKKAIKA